MGCAASTISDVYLEKSDQSKVDRDTGDESAPENSNQRLSGRLNRNGELNDPSENCCPFCDFDDELSVIRRSRAASTDVTASLNQSQNTSSSQITIDRPYIVEDDFEMSHSAIIVASRSDSSPNIHGPGESEVSHTSHSSPSAALLALLNAGFGCGTKGNDQNSHPNSPSKALQQFSDSPLPEARAKSLSSAGNSNTSEFSSPCKTKFVSMSVYDNHNTPKSTSISSPGDHLGCPTPFKTGAARSSANQIETGAVDSDVYGDDETGTYPYSDDGLSGRMYLNKLFLPVAGVGSLSNAQTRIPFSQSSENLPNAIMSEYDEDDDIVVANRVRARELKTKRSFGFASPKSKAEFSDDMRESVKDCVDKIEVATLEHKQRNSLPPLLTDDEVNGPMQRRTSRSTILQPLSPNKFPPRMIAAVGNRSFREKSAENLFVGGFHDVSVKDMVGKIQSPKPAPAQRSLSQYFTPVTHVSRHRRASTNSDRITPDGGGSAQSSRDSHDSPLGTKGGSEPSYPPSRSMNFTPHSPVDISSMTECEPVRVKSIIQNWGMGGQAHSPGGCDDKFPENMSVSPMSSILVV